jgi:hypothetical protein
MIDVYSGPTPDGHKAYVLLEETGLQYRIHDGIDARRTVCSAA